MYCTKCGMQLSDEWKTCLGCGTKIDGQEAVEQMEERAIEISAGELTVSGQRKLTTELLIKGHCIFCGYLFY